MEVRRGSLRLENVEEKRTNGQDWRGPGVAFLPSVGLSLTFGGSPISGLLLPPAPCEKRRRALGSLGYPSPGTAPGAQ